MLPEIDSTKSVSVHCVDLLHSLPVITSPFLPCSLADRPALPKTIMIIFVVIDLLQLLVIPLSPAQGMTWNDQPIMSSIYKFLLSVNLLPRPEGSPIYNASSLVIASLVIAAIFSSFFLWLWLSEAFSAPGTAHSQWRSRIIWWFFPVLAYALWTPFVGGLIAPFSCLTIGGGSASAVWMNTTITCFSGPHIGMLVSGVFILFAFCGTMMLLTVTLVDRRTTIAGKDNEVAAVHGRVDAALLFVKLILAAFFVLGFGSNPWITVIISLLAGLVWLGLYTYYLPYYRLSMNQVQAGASAVFLCAGVAAALSVAVGASSSNSGVILFLFLLLPVGYSAIRCVAAARCSSYILVVFGSSCFPVTCPSHAFCFPRSFIIPLLSLFPSFPFPPVLPVFPVQPCASPLALSVYSDRPLQPFPHRAQGSFHHRGLHRAGRPLSTQLPQRSWRLVSQVESRLC